MGNPSRVYRRGTLFWQETEKGARTYSSARKKGKTFFWRNLNGLRIFFIKMGALIFVLSVYHCWFTRGSFFSYFNFISTLYISKMYKVELILESVCFWDTLFWKWRRKFFFIGGGGTGAKKIIWWKKGQGLFFQFRGEHCFKPHENWQAANWPGWRRHDIRRQTIQRQIFLIEDVSATPIRWSTFRWSPFGDGGCGDRLFGDWRFSDLLYLPMYFKSTLALIYIHPSSFSQIRIQMNLIWEKELGCILSSNKSRPDTGQDFAHSFFPADP